MRAGKIIEFEGLDASGKKTQADLLKLRLEKEGFKAEIISFPRYSEFFGDLVKRYLTGEFGTKEQLGVEFAALLYTLDRYQIKNEIEEKLEKGKVVVMDRYISSNLAFQTAKYSNAREKKDFFEWIKTVEGRLPQPRAMFFLDMPRKAAEQLMAKRGHSKHSNKKDQHETDSVFLDKVRKQYLDLCKTEKGWYVISCARKKGKEWIIFPPEQIHEMVWKKIRKLFLLNYTLKEIYK